MSGAQHDDQPMAMPFDIPGGWVRRIVTLCDRQQFELILPADPDRVLEAQLEAEQDRLAGSDRPAFDPYWATLWSAAIPTAEAVLRTSWRGDESVLELGCGAGLVGLAAMARGLAVTFTDHIPHALELAGQNASHNGYQPRGRHLLDWHQPPELAPDERYQLLLASDVLYDLSVHASLLNTIEALLATQGTCWIGDPGRVHSTAFYHLASDRFDVRLFDPSGITIHWPVVGEYQLFVLARRGSAGIVHVPSPAEDRQ